MRALPSALASLAAVACLLASARADAQDGDGSPGDVEAARAHYQKGEHAAAAGDWGVAAREYLAAHEITGDAVLFFKIGEAHQRAGDCDAAVRFYRRYLDEAPNAEAFRERTEAEISTCERQVPDKPGGGDSPASEGAEGPTTDAGGPATDPGAAEGSESPGATGSEPRPAAPEPGRAALPSFADSEPTWQRSAAWFSVGGAVTLATIGGMLGLSARSRAEDIEHLTDFRDPTGNPATYAGPTRERYDDLVREGDELERYALLAFAGAGAAAAAAVIFFLLDPGDAEATTASSRAPRVTPTAGGGAVGLSAGWSF